MRECPATVEFAGRAVVGIGVPTLAEAGCDTHVFVRFHWYWPFAREEELDWAIATARPDDTVVVQVIDRVQAPSAGAYGQVSVVRDLPEIKRGVSRLGWLPSRTVTYARRAAARSTMWRSGSFDLVHLHYLNRFTDAVVPLPSPLVMSVHDVVPHVPRLGSRVEHELLRRTYLRADGLVVHHESLRHRLDREFGVDPSRVHVVHHQVFAAPEVGPPPEDKPPMLLFFGALRANKGLPVLLQAMEKLKNVELRLVIAGRGDVGIEALAQQASASDPRVTAEVGFVTLARKRELMAEASLIILPYTSFASQSGVLHDAYSHARPVVVTDVGALGDSVREDGTGLVATPGDPDSLATQIAAALDPQRWSTFSGASSLIREARSPLRTGQRLRSVYDVILGGA